MTWILRIGSLPHCHLYPSVGLSYFFLSEKVPCTVKIFLYIGKKLGFPRGSADKEPACQCRRHKRLRFNPWVRKTPWRRKWQPTPVFLPGEFHGQRSLVDYSPGGHEESIEHARTGHVRLWFSLSVKMLTYTLTPLSYLRYSLITATSKKW